MDGQQAYAQLKDQTNAWVASLTTPDYIAKLRKPKPTDVKIIRDAVTGYQILEPHEYLVLDHPLLQRLHYIHQTALAYLVYPTAHHTRFDHSLGCAKIASNIGDRLISHEDRSLILELRLAAFLHDVGHTFFSHLSESIIQAHFIDFYKALREAPEFRGLKLNISEMMSYLIVMSDSFQKFLDPVVHYYHDGVDLENVARLIIHKPVDGLAFMADIISGPFDVDKLDYLVRDCYFTGIRADVDVERLVVSVAKLDKDRFPATDEKWRRRSLVMLSGGVSILEQITFNKMLLFPAIYHHHKVRAIECMVKALFEILWEKPDQITDKRIRFENIIDFYNFTEKDFFAHAEGQTLLNPIIRRLLNRDLMERCLVLFPRYTEDPSGWLHLSKRHYEDNPEEIRWLRELIFNEVPPVIRKDMNLYDLWVDIPKPPPLGDPDAALVDIGTDEILPLSDFFPYPHWISSYQSNKLKGHVFSMPNQQTKTAVNLAARKVLGEQFGLECLPRATTECKLD